MRWRQRRQRFYFHDSIGQFQSIVVERSKFQSIVGLVVERSIGKSIELEFGFVFENASTHFLYVVGIDRIAKRHLVVVVVEIDLEQRKSSRILFLQRMQSRR